MSRILFDAIVHGQKIPIALGWDRPLRECFVSINVHVLDDELTEDERFDDLFTASCEAMTSGMGPSDVQNVLSRGGIDVPPGTIELLKKHILDDAGNVIVSVAADGTQTVHLSEATGPDQLH